MVQQYDEKEAEREVSEKIAARVFSMEYLSDLIPSAFSSLQDNGYFYDIAERGMGHSFLYIALLN